MAKTIFTSGEVDKFISRVLSLKAEQKPLWGKMNSTEMLFHCNLANDAIIGAPKAKKKPTLKQRFFQFIFFHIKKDFPRGARAAKRFDIKDQIDQNAFEAEKAKFIELLGKFKLLDHKLEGAHPVFGSLNHFYWGRFVWKHIDHHLKQFGL